MFERHAKEERRVGETSAEPLRRSGGAPTGVLPATLLLAVVFAISFALCVKNNDFPLHYHEDEGTKAAQVAADQRNFHQPQLMLEVAQWAWRAAGGPSDSQATVQIGRAVSAAFVALAAVAAATVGYRLGGVAGLYLVGAFVAMCPVPVVYGHYMKEDAARAFGVMLVVLASHVFWTRRTRGAAAPAVLLLGGACAVAASAKFAGAFALGACVPLVFFAGMPAWRVRVVRLALLLAAFVVVGAIVNHRVLGHTRLALERIESEHRHATTRHVGFTMSRPNLFHVAASAKQTMSHVLGLRAGCVGFGLARPRQAGGWALFLVMFTAGYLALISWSVLPYNRYALPVVVLAHLLAALAVIRVVQQVPPGARRRAAALVAMGLVVALRLPRCVDFARQFGDDNRDRLRLWAVRNLPADAVLVQDGLIDVDGPLDPRLKVAERPQFLIYGTTTYEAGPAPSAGPLKDLAAMGVEYVAVTDFWFGRYFEPNIKRAADATAVFEYRRNWYCELFREHELVWASAPAHPTCGHFNNPELRLYRLVRPAPGGAS